MGRTYQIIFATEELLAFRTQINLGNTDLPLIVLRNRSIECPAQNLMPKADAYDTDTTLGKDLSGKIG